MQAAWTNFPLKFQKFKNKPVKESGWAFNGQEVKDFDWYLYLDLCGEDICVFVPFLHNQFPPFSLRNGRNREALQNRMKKSEKEGFCNQVENVIFPAKEKKRTKQKKNNKV